MTQDRRTLKGRTFPPVTRVIQEEDLRDFLEVTGEIHPAFEDPESARTLGYQRRVIPPSFAPFVALGIIRSFDWDRDFLVDSRKGMPAIFGEQELEYLRPIYVGERLTIQSVVAEVLQKKSKRPFDLARVELTATDESGDPVLHGHMGFIFFR